MPLMYQNANLIALFTANHQMSGSFLSLGRLCPVLGLTYGEASEILNSNGMDVGPLALSDSQAVLSDEKVFLEALGYDHYSVMDVDAYEGVDHLFDLNNSETPLELYECFDVVYTNGTLEHIFDVPAALRNMCRMTRPGGFHVHAAPSNNHLDHGFYQFSPTLFFDFYAANKYTIENCLLVSFDKKGPSNPWTWKEYNPYEMEHPHALDGKLDNRIYVTFFVARKTPTATHDAIPQQGLFRTIWERSKKKRDRSSIQRGNTCRHPWWTRQRLFKILRQVWKYF